MKYSSTVFKFTNKICLLLFIKLFKFYFFYLTSNYRLNIFHINSWIFMFVPYMYFKSMLTLILSPTIINWTMKQYIVICIFFWVSRSLMSMHILNFSKGLVAIVECANEVKVVFSLINFREFDLFIKINRFWFLFVYLTFDIWYKFFWNRI